LVDRLRAFVAHRTVSSDPRYRAECRRGASFLRSILKEFGADTYLLTPEDSNLNPVIHAVFRGRPNSSKPGKRILFYGHYDVIPAENEQGKWNTDPFQMEGIDEYLYGRGTSDNKGPILAAIYAVAELIAEKALESDVVFIIEGEEECGSRGFEKVIRTHKDDIGPVDWILLANSYWLDDHVPCLTYGLRGIIHATLEVSSDRPDLHSGVEGSSLTDESLKDLILLLNSLVGKNGKVKLPGFYDPVLPMTKSEATLYKDITNTLLSRNPALGGQDMLAEKLQQKWRNPSLTIHKFSTSGPENSTIIPRKAWAAISLRLVPNQEADEIAADLTDYLQDEFSKLETSNILKVIIDRKAEPWLGDFNNEMYKTLEQGVMRAWYGSSTSNGGENGNHSTNGQNQSSSSLTLDHLPPRRPLYIREGGSIPAIRFLEKEFGAQAAHLPCGQASDHAHLDNERLRLVNLYKSRDVFKWVFRELPKK
jgi:di- and tripeptidase